MNARKFVAATSREALRLVRDELGADAVVLSNRKVDEGVEIMAVSGAEFAGLTQERKAEPAHRAPVQAQPVVTMPAPVAAAPEMHSAIILEQQGILSEIKSMRDMVQEQLACLSWSDMQQRDPQRARMLRDLLNAGFSPALSRQLLDKMPADTEASWLRQVLGLNLRVATQEEDVVVRGGVLALIGPTGVGKTTTTAKLAARAVVRYGADKVALITTDSYRIGAHEQLRIYGKILGVEVHAVRDTEDLRLTLSALKKKHLVLIDTIGMGQRDKRVAGQTEMFDACGVQRLLLLNATSGGDTLDDVVRMYHGTGVVGCIPTKLDEAVSLGTVLDVVVRHKLTLHYITNGQRVPEDLHEVNLEYLLHRALKPAARAATFTLNELEFPMLMAGVGSASARNLNTSPANGVQYAA
ncbi:MAG: flagellar biosynthesis protein FlhF [Nitrosomonadales bacterium]|nr:flagellar biosynthesis protein FlhF [Nitrosomonadales bacterium]